MALDLERLCKAMIAAGSGAFANSWNQVKAYTMPELKKIAATFVDIEHGLTANPPYYTPDSVRILLQMQLTASQAVIIATTALTLIEVQRAFNAIMAAIKDTVNGAVSGALGFDLIP